MAGRTGKCEATEMVMAGRYVDRVMQGAVEDWASCGGKDGRHICLRRSGDGINGQYGRHGREMEDHEEFSA